MNENKKSSEKYRYSSIFFQDFKKDKEKAQNHKFTRMNPFTKKILTRLSDL